MHPVATNLNTLRGELEASFFEREDVIYSMCLALLAGEHHFAVGPPGTAKSQLVRAFVRAIIGADYFEAILSKTRPAEAVLGPLDIKEFRDNGNYFLKRRGFASAVHFVFLDEIGKMSPVLGHDLLALLNERIYHEVNGGLSVHQAPLHTAFTASNEMPMNESDDAAALWDRLLVRVYVDYIKERQAWLKMLTAPAPVINTKIDFVDLDEVTRVDVPAITMSESAQLGMVTLKTQFEDQQIVISDRRWRASMKVLRASAFLGGRTEVQEADLGALRFTLWESLEQIETITSMAVAIGNPFEDTMKTARLGLAEIRQGIKDRENLDENAKMAYSREAGVKLAAVRDSLDDILKTAGDRAVPDFRKLSDEHLAVQTELFIKMIEMDDATAALAAQARAGLGHGTQTS